MQEIYKGTSKTLYHAEEDYALILSFNDSMRTTNNEVVDIPGKGIVNNSISSYIMQKLDMIGIENHFIQKNNMRQQLVQFVDVCPVQVHVCTIACERYVSDFGMESGFVFESPVIDFRVNNHKLNYPPVNENQILSFGWLSRKEIKEIKTTSVRIHDFLSGMFATAGIRLVDIKLEFGRVFDGENFVIMLVDEISPDTCRLWDMKTNEKLCYETAAFGNDKIFPAYQEVLNRLNVFNLR
jgi:phosphoribosylaminoimidazole-succinocarboxamide synthase